MKKLMANLYLRRGFTLIELMIVIVILGVLMGTILPRLTGAQARARDTGRISDLNNIAQALEVYYNDNGTYPPTSNAALVCLNPAPAANTTLPSAGSPMSGDQVSVALGAYMKGAKVPRPPSQTQTIGSTTGTCTGMYGYKPLAKDSIPNAAYLLVTDVETWQLSNADWSAQSSFTNYNGSSAITVAPRTSETADARNSVFIYLP